MSRRVRAYSGEFYFQRENGAAPGLEGCEQRGLSRRCDGKRLETFAADLLQLYRDYVAVFRKPRRGGLKRCSRSLTKLFETSKRLRDWNGRFPAYEDACPGFDYRCRIHLAGRVHRRFDSPFLRTISVLIDGIRIAVSSAGRIAEEVSMPPTESIAQEVCASRSRLRAQLPPTRAGRFQRQPLPGLLS